MIESLISRWFLKEFWKKMANLFYALGDFLFIFPFSWLIFLVTPIQGDAHHISIIIWGMTKIFWLDLMIVQIIDWIWNEISTRNHLAIT